MTTFASKTDLVMEPRGSVNLGAAAVGYLTPVAWRHNLGGMALINGTKAALKYKLERTGGAAAVDLELRVKTAGGAVLHTETISALAAGATIQGKSSVDLGGISGGSDILVEVEVLTADAGTAATLDAAMSYESPVIVAGC